jgi:dephospho-CoA kinase
MLVIGLTGGIGSGKSTVGKLFAELGVELVDADQLAREVVEPGTPALRKIAAHFGENLLLSNGSLDRAALREIVFANPEQRRWLEQLLHPPIGQLLKTRLAACQSAYCILESPLLLETSQVELVDRVLVVDVSETTQLNRALKRDGSDQETIKGIIAAQMPRRQRLAKADEILDNEGSPDELRPQVEKLHKIYLTLAQSHE